MANLQGPYLGQTPPGLGFTQFAPGIVPADIYNSPTVSPDGQEIYWAARTGIMVTRMSAEGHWTTPQFVSFGGRSSTAGDDAPVVSPDNGTLFFNVRTPGTRSGFSYWHAERTPSGWSEPRPLPDVIIATGTDHWHVSVTNTGTLYFGALSDSGGRIYRSRSVGGTFEAPEPVGVVNSLGYVVAPFIAPDESYLLFSRVTNGRVDGHFVSFMGQDDQWLAPRSLVGLPQDAETYFVTRDGRYLFCRCYWASAQIIENLRTTAW